ncbi:hypothetical protein GJ496_006309 [Pomphorhynchus laevis]|nr:hypothetical protein GJ496_006309 [Pomphorhynchus laevis]
MKINVFLLFVALQLKFCSTMPLKQIEIVWNRDLLHYPHLGKLFSFNIKSVPYEDEMFKELSDYLFIPLHDEKRHKSTWLNYMIG